MERKVNAVTSSLIKKALCTTSHHSSELDWSNQILTFHKTPPKLSPIWKSCINNQESSCFLFHYFHFFSPQITWENHLRSWSGAGRSRRATTSTVAAAAAAKRSGTGRWRRRRTAASRRGWLCRKSSPIARSAGFRTRSRRQDLATSICRCSSARCIIPAMVFPKTPTRSRPNSLSKIVWVVIWFFFFYSILWFVVWEFF